MSERPYTGNEPLQLRQCGRCRRIFPADPALHLNGLPEWWLCPSCHELLLGPAESPTLGRERPVRTTT
jgi:hypothetical protein